MAELRQGPHRSRDIAHELGRDAQPVAPIRSRLIAKDRVWRPSHADTDFTVPMFDESMHRIMPGEDARQ